MVDNRDSVQLLLNLIQISMFDENTKYCFSLSLHTILKSIRYTITDLEQFAVIVDVDHINTLLP